MRGCGYFQFIAGQSEAQVTTWTCNWQEGMEGGSFVGLSPQNVGPGLTPGSLCQNCLICKTHTLSVLSGEVN